MASFLQRLGRTGRRPGSVRNCLFLAVDQDELLHAAGLLHCWSRGWGEPVVPPPDPRHIVGSVGDDVLLADPAGSSRVLLLAGRSWLVTDVDWKRRRCFVEPADLPGKARWSGFGLGLSFAVSRGMRDVLLGADPDGVTATRRAAGALADLREHHSGHVTSGATVLRQALDGDLHWWTWAGTAANRTLLESLPDLVDPAQRVGDSVLRLRHGRGARDVAQALGDSGTQCSDRRRSTTMPFAG